jgi:hypothetical protein
MDNLVDIVGNYFPDEIFFDYHVKKVPFSKLNNTLRPSNQSTVCKIFPQDKMHKAHILESNPWILCHDQEPLDFNFYEDKNNHNDFILSRSDNRPLSEIQKTKNLRWYLPSSIHKKWVLLHSELQSNEVEKYNDSNLFNCAYWWSHAMLSLDWYRFAEYDSFLNPGTNLQKLFLVYSRDTTGTRQYRKEVVQKLPNSCQTQSWFSTKVTSDFSAVYNADDFNRTGISVILETIFDERIHLTEKTLRPIACGHPFIIMSGPNTLSYLRNYGFKTFHPLINECYDAETDTEKRQEKILQEIHRIGNLSSEQQKELVTSCLHIAQHNKKVFFSQHFRNQVIEEMLNNIHAAYDSTIDWQYLIHSRIERKRFGVGMKNGKSSQWYVPFARHIKKGGTVSDYIPPWEK